MTLEVLGRVGMFAGCSRDDLGPLADAVTQQKVVRAGDVLCREGDDVGAWWVVLSGRAEVTVGGAAVGSVGPDETVGELALFAGGSRSATVTATADLDVLEFGRAGFLDVVAATPPLALTLLEEAARRLRATNALV